LETCNKELASVEVTSGSVSDGEEDGEGDGEFLSELFVFGLSVIFRDPCFLLRSTLS